MEKKVVKIYNVEDIAMYNRIVNLPSGHVIKFNEFNTEVHEEDINFFQRSDEFVIRTWREVIFENITEAIMAKSPAPIILESEGLMYGVSGFAEALRNVTYFLYKKGLIMVARPSDGPVADGVEVFNTKKGKVIRELSHIRYSSEKEYPHISIQMTVPDGIKKRGNMYTVAYVMFETVDFPKKFTQYLERNADEIWTPSEFNVENIKRSGWTKPIFRMPLGSDTKRFNPLKYKPFQPTESPIGSYKDKFVFLSIMGWSERKGVMSLLESYLKEFGKNDNVVLYLKGGWYDQNKANAEVRSAIDKFNSNNTPLVVTDFKIYTDQEHPRLYKTANAFVLASRGEGWGLNYTEAMAMELPTIGTAATSMVDFMDTTNSFPIKVKRFCTEPRCDWISPDYVGALFADPDIDSLRKQMRSVFDNREKAKKIGKKARQDMINKWSWEEASELQVERLKEIAEKL